MPVEVVPISAFSDNYIWAIRDSASDQVVVVDPGDSVPVFHYLEEHDYRLSAILVTHHHADHQGGIPGLLKEYPSVPVYGPAREFIEGCTHPLKEGDQPSIPGLLARVNVFDIPGHTAGHIAYLIEPNMCFCGDTLFSAGCGRLFEGTAAQMVESLNKLVQLGDTTEIYCGHEYTLKNLQFAKILEPNNLHIQNYYEKIMQLRARKKSSLPSTIAIEKQINPFLRCHEKAIIESLKADDTIFSRDLENIFSLLRKWKDGF